MNASKSIGVFVAMLIGALGVGTSGCKKSAERTNATDAHGYICAKCNAKVYTKADETLGNQCPQCQQAALWEVVGFTCPNDQHVTIQVKPPRFIEPICEQCKTNVGGTLFQPKEKDLTTWGATKVTGKKS